MDLNGNNHDGFIDIDTVLSDRQQKGPTSVDSDYKGMADMVDSETRGGSLAGCSKGEHTASQSGQDFILIQCQI